MDDKQIIKEFGIALKSLREKKGISQEVLAHAIDSHPTHISRLENGHKQPTLTTLIKLAKCLDVGFSELVSKAIED